MREQFLVVLIATAALKATGQRPLLNSELLCAVTLHVLASLSRFQKQVSEYCARKLGKILKRNVTLCGNSNQAYFFFRILTSLDVIFWDFICKHGGRNDVLFLLVVKDS